MRKHLALLPLLLLAAVAAARSTVKMTISMTGVEVGMATMTAGKSADGGISGSMKLNMDFGGQTADVNVQFASSKTGRPKFISEVVKSDQGTESYKLTYTATHVIVDSVDNGKRKSKKVALPKGKRFEDASELWFLVTKPKPGAVSRSWAYDRKAGKFKEEVARYIGRKTITVSGKSVQAHEITHEDGSMWLDDQGMPLRLKFKESGMEMTLDRVWR